jgi:hypothetical protein
MPHPQQRPRPPFAPNAPRRPRPPRAGPPSRRARPPRRAAGVVPAVAAVLLATSIAPAADGTAVRLTIYNQDFAVVTEARTLALERGENVLRVADVTALLQPDSVVLRDPADPDGVRVLSQAYRPQALGVAEMLRRHEGKMLRFQVTNPATGAVETRSARLIRAGGWPATGDGAAPIVETADGRIQFSLPGEPVFDALPADAALRPHLTWTVAAAKGGKRDLELSYATGGLSWNATYNAVLAPDAGRLDLVGWVNVENRSGAAFREARVRLLAGQVSRAAPRPPGLPILGRNVQAQVAVEGMAPGVAERGLDEYHLYALERPVTLEDGQSTQVEFRRAAGVPVTRFYVFDGARSPAVRATVEFVNAKPAGLGGPLPAGILRMFRAAADGSRELIGETAVSHLPADEKVRAEIGAAFDLVGERRPVEAASMRDREKAEETWEIKLRNRKQEPAEIRVVERLERGGTWRILESSDPFDRKDARTIEFRVRVPPGAEKVVTYRVRYTW